MKPCVLCTLIACITAIVIATEFAWVTRKNVRERNGEAAAEFLLLHPEIAHPQQPSIEVTPDRGEPTKL